MARIKYVRPGDKLLFRHRGDMKPDGHYEDVLEEWTVIETFSHHALCEHDGIRESFTYGELVQMGLEKTETGSEMDAVDGFHRWNEQEEDDATDEHD